jgi:cytochrome c oxidase subunit 2
MKKIRIFLLSGFVLFGFAAMGWADEPITNWLTSPEGPLARAVRSNFYFSMAAFLPFLILSEVLLVYAIFRFKAKPGGQAATFHENLRLEVLWTVIPALTLAITAIPTFKTMRAMEVPPKSDLVVAVIGHQFFWEYRYPKYGVQFAEEALVVPAGKVVTLNLSSVDVVHSWWVPAFGVKQDANPGRITHAWFQADNPGRYKGQCAELCGKLHAKMYIDVNVVAPEEFEQWIMKKKGASLPAQTTGSR